MSKWQLRLGQYGLIAAMFCAAGGHWMVLQSVAWGGMFVDYARMTGVVAAMQTTFDGQHPCGLCKEIQKRRGTEQKPDTQVIVQKLELFFVSAPAFVIPERKVWMQIVADDGAQARLEEPLVPPPRV
jgi:hypothetical protein